ncbi:hypothetical protein [Actinorugispora endophytica]|uniref:Uncharacterized protein n=1 Tax=Actinorugispora endophytica TaxID=1605990 RepID=A0A4R6V4L8_9ACTN|nr:hypothetical protein [Actinorugispora endophytica]TDQ53759.1 hypothetical protein EV190_103210 [Actinorugispora endophytica]
MPVNNPPPLRPPAAARSQLLSDLAGRVRALGGVALLALADGEHPVLYVRSQDRTVPVVLVQGVTGGWWFIWGRSGWADSSQVDRVAATLAAPTPAPGPGPACPDGVPASGRHASLKAVA